MSRSRISRGELSFPSRKSHTASTWKAYSGWVQAAAQGPWDVEPRRGAGDQSRPAKERRDLAGGAPPPRAGRLGEGGGGLVVGAGAEVAERAVARRGGLADVDQFARRVRPAVDAGQP